MVTWGMGWLGGWRGWAPGRVGVGKRFIRTYLVISEADRKGRGGAAMGEPAIHDWMAIRVRELSPILGDGLMDQAAASG